MTLNKTVNYVNFIVYCKAVHKYTHQALIKSIDKLQSIDNLQYI